MKLSEMWRQAAKELTQIKEDYGYAPAKTACAAGSVSYYLSQGRTCAIWSLTPTEKVEYWRLLGEFSIDAEQGIITINDDLGWTFEQFAKKAEQLGL